MTDGDPRPASTQERLLAAATAVFLEKGYAGTRVQDVAKRAGLSVGAIYANFENKADLLSRAIAAEGAAAFSSVASRLGEDVPPGRMALEMHVQVLAGPPEPYHKLILESLAAARHDDDAAAPLRQTLGLLDAANRALIERGRGDGTGIDPLITTDALATFLQTVMLGSFVVKALELHQATTEEATVLVERFLASLAPPARSAPGRRTARKGTAAQRAR